jgi:hypothetical protein
MRERQFEVDGYCVTFEVGKGWLCTCTNVHVEFIDLGLHCFHWPICEHMVKAAKLSEPIEE